MNQSLLQILRSPPVGAERSDAQLLAQYARNRDEEAFARIVRRHAPMVLGVCRRVLGNRADADDAFQATFLVLARKASGLDTCAALAGWLHGVAFNIARKLRHMNAQRKARERPSSAASESGSLDPLRDELLAALDEELNRLPEKYRTPIVLCDLEGLTRKEAAERLGCPEGTVAGRLARARSRLAAQLAGRGLAPVGMIAGTAAGQLAPAAAPDLIGPVLEAAVRETVSPRVLALTEGVLKAMFLQKLRTALGVVVMCALALVGFSRVTATAPDAKADAMPVVKGAPAQVAPAAKRLTVIQLRKLDTQKVIDPIMRSLPRRLENAIHITYVDEDNTLLVYADEAGTKRVEETLQKLGEPHMAGVVIRFQNANATVKAAELYRKPDVSLTPIPEEGVLLVYGEQARVKELERAVRKFDVEFGLIPPVAKNPVRHDKPEGPQLEMTVFRLRHVSAEATARVLTEVFGTRSGMRIAYDAAANSVVVQASPADLELIRKLLNTAIDAPPRAEPVPVPAEKPDAPLAHPAGAAFTENPSAGTEKLSVMNVDGLDTKEVSEVLAVVFQGRPRVRVTAMADGKRLMVYADDETMKEIRETIAKFQVAVKPDDLKMVRQMAEDVEAYRDHVQWAERQVRLGHLTPARLEVERVKLSVAEVALSLKKSDALTPEQKTRTETNLFRLVEGLPNADPRGVESCRAYLRSVQHDLKDATNKPGLPPAAKGRSDEPKPPGKGR